jgi:hypothetical protein
MREASCSCGQLKLSYNGEITRQSVCHCFEYQKRTGSAFGVQTRLEKEKVSVTGTSTVYTRKGDSGGEISFHFCPQCGTTVYWEIAAMPEFIILAVGCLTDPNLPSPAMMVYGNRKHNWVVMPESAIEYFDE